jgi:hypothetical protein
MTVAFEFGFGHWVDGDSWSELLENYDVTAGKVWVLVPAAMAAGPELARRMAARERDDVRATPRLWNRWRGGAAVLNTQKRSTR